MKYAYGIAVSAVLLLFFGLFNGIIVYGPVDAANDESSPEINYFKVDATIDNNYAVTEITEEFYNPYDHAVDSKFSIRIPEKAFISNFSLSIDGDTYYAEVVSKDYAKQEYNKAVSSGQDAALVESHGKATFSYSISLSPNQTITVGLVYEQFLEKKLGDYTYNLYLTGGNIDSRVKKLDMNIDIVSELAITSVKIPEYKDAVTIENETEKDASISFMTDALPPSYDFTLVYELEPVNINGKILNYNDGTTGYFSHVFSPQMSDLGGSPMDKDIIFVLDKSGSMSGDKMTQLKDAFDEIVHELRAGDTFNIIMFDNSINKYNNALLTASSENKDAASGYIYEISAGGSTNINDALTTGLGMFGDTTETVPLIVFLTDGLPTAGITNPSSIRSNILTANKESVAIFSLGFGNDVDFEFLKALSLENNGKAQRIEVGSDASNQLTNFYDTISTPLLKSLDFEYPEGVYDVHPSYVEQLFEGSEIVITGKYKLDTESLTGNVYTNSKEGKQTFSQTFDLKENTEHSFIPRLWAYNKIQGMLDELTVEGNNETKIGEVVNLALEFSFVTPYTSLLITVEPPKEDSKEENTKEDEKDQPSGDPLKDTTTDSKLVDTDGDGFVDSYDTHPQYDNRWNKTKPSDKDNDDAISGLEEAGFDDASSICVSIFLIVICLMIPLIIFVISKINKKE